jgi:hypothetical protein
VQLRFVTMRTLFSIAVATVMTTLVAGCSDSGPSSEDDASLGEDAITSAKKVCTRSAKCPSTFGELSKMSSGELKELFDKGAVGDTVFKGIYSGLPLCFPQELPRADQFPAGARAVTGFDPLVGALRLLGQKQMNDLAGFIWHGKKFTPMVNGTITTVNAQNQGKPLVPIAGVVNNIGRTDVDFSAEAVLNLNRRDKSIDLDYHGAKTGLQLPLGLPIPGISGISTEIIQHIWDRVRLIDPKQNLYLGVAYVVDKPGVYDASAVPMCFFALTPEGSPAASTK